MNSHRQENRHYQVRYRQQSSSVFMTILRFIGFIALSIAVIVGGLWLVGATIGLVVGLVVGLFALAIGLAPVIFLGWLVWLVMKAIFV